MRNQVRRAALKTDGITETDSSHPYQPTDQPCKGQSHHNDHYDDDYYDDDYCDDDHE